jgi:hypothetical protein
MTPPADKTGHSGRIVAHLATLYVEAAAPARREAGETVMYPLHQTMGRTFFGALAILMLTAGPVFAADPVFPIASRVGLVPPPGFVVSTKFSGFENPQANAAILLVAMPPDAYPELEKSFTDEMLKSRGIQVATREAITLKDGKGILVAGPKEADGTKRYEAVFIASVAGATTLISMQMLETSRAILTDAVIRDTLKTVAVRLQVPESEQLAVLPYKVGNLAGFHVVLSGQDGTAILTLGPKDAVTEVEQPYILIGLVTGEAPKPEERDKIARQAFASAPGIKDVKIIRAEPLRIGQASGYEIVAEAKDSTSNVDVTTVQWLRFGTNAHLRVFAIARRSSWNEVFPKMRAVRDGIEPR